MATHSIEEIRPTQLLLDTQNPRYEELAGQDAALKEMLDKQKAKLVKLAGDIVENGLSPSDLPIVIPAPNGDEGMYLVLEGNRRVAAIKVLANPELIKLASDKATREKLEALSEGYGKSPVERINCVMFESRKDASHWIELRHRGENQGVGIVQWDAQATDRFRERLTGKVSAEKQVLEFVKQEGELGRESLKNIDKFPLSSLKRLVSDPDVRKRLGLKTVDSKVQSLFVKEEVAKGLTRIVGDLADQSITVTDIKQKQDRADYIEGIPDSNLPDPSQTAESAWPLDDPGKATKAATTTKKKKKKSKPPSYARKALIPKSVTLSIEHPRINRIYYELRSLDVEGYTNSCAVMLRVFLELSLDEYSAREGGVFHSNDKLSKKIRRAANDMQSKGYLSKDDLKPIRTAASKPDDLFSTSTLNAYVHNSKIQPIAKDLKITWDNTQQFFEKLHE